jgi:hypothetical protein
VLAGGAADLLHDRLGRLLGRSWFLSHRHVLRGYDEPETLPSSTHPICLMSADGGHPRGSTPPFVAPLLGRSLEGNSNLR